MLEKLVEIQTVQESSLMVFCGIFICVSIIQILFIHIKNKILKHLKSKNAFRGVNTSIAKILHKITFIKL